MTIVFALALPVRGEPNKLRWGKERMPAATSTTPSTTLKFVKPAVAGAQSAGPAAPRIATSANSAASANRTSGSQNNRQGNDSGAIIQLAAYEFSAPRLTSGREAEPETETRSVVVNRDGESADGFRAAQLPAVDTGAGGTKDPSGSGKPGAVDELRSPFTDNPPEPPQPSPLPMPEGETAPALPPPSDNQLQQEQQPAEPAGAGQFQPVLPSGPPQPEQAPAAEPAEGDAALKEEGAKAQESCEKSVQNLRAYTVDKVDLNIAISGTAGQDYPFECSIDDGTMHAGRCWEQITYMWKASALCHKPLYFEDEQLERYGHSFTPCLQPFVSGAHFFTRLPVLPYCMGVEPPQECIYALGHYRPGSCAPYMFNPIPLSLRGGLFEAGAVVGTAAVLP